MRFMSNSVDVFASCGADGSVRMFDLRSLEHSTIIYEPTAGKPSGGAEGRFSAWRPNHKGNTHHERGNSQDRAHQVHHFLRHRC